MLITALSNLAFVLTTAMLGVGIYLTLQAIRKYHNYKSAYGDMAIHAIPSIQQVKRLRELKTLEYKCMILIASVFVLLVLVAIQF